MLIHKDMADGFKKCDDDCFSTVSSTVSNLETMDKCSIECDAENIETNSSEQNLTDIDFEKTIQRSPLPVDDSVCFEWDPEDF